MMKRILLLSAAVMGVYPLVKAQSVTYNHDDAKMNQITVMERGSGGLTPALYYTVLHKSYQKSASSKNKLAFRTTAGLNLYAQVDDAEALDSALNKRAKIEALNVADRSGGVLDLAWVAGTLERVLQRVSMRHQSGTECLYAQCPAKKGIPMHLCGCGTEK